MHYTCGWTIGQCLNTSLLAICDEIMAENMENKQCFVMVFPGRRWESCLPPLVLVPVFCALTQVSREGVCPGSSITVLD